MVKLRVYALSTVLALSTLALHAQYKSNYNYTTRAFQHMDFSVTAGSTGIGFDVATPVTDFLHVRAGFSFMPHFDYDVTFGIEAGRYDANGVWKATSQKQIQNYINQMKQLTGLTADTEVQATGNPSFYNAKLMFDFLPFRNKHWHLTAGFYFGPSKVATAVNKTEDMPTLIALTIYNQMYEKAVNGEPILSYGEGDNAISIYKPELANNGRMGFLLGYYNHDVYYTEDVYWTSFGFDENGPHEAGDVRYHAGDVKYHAGDPYMMEPDENSMARVAAYVNKFRPYLGFGYGGRLLKGNDDYHISFDCGAMFWGGTPDLIAHDGTNLTKDVRNVSGKVGTYVDLVKTFKVFPVLNLRITRRF